MFMFNVYPRALLMSWCLPYYYYNENYIYVAFIHSNIPNKKASENELFAMHFCIKHFLRVIFFLILWNNRKDFYMARATNRVERGGVCSDLYLYRVI